MFLFNFGTATNVWFDGLRGISLRAGVPCSSVPSKHCGRAASGKASCSLSNPLQFLVPSISHEAIPKRPNESCLLRKTHDVWEGTSSDQWPSITQNLSSPLIRLCGQVTKFHPSLQRSEARSYLWNRVHHKRTIGLTWVKISLANGEMGEDKDSHKCDQRPDQDHYCEPSHRFSSKMLRKFLNLLSGSLASDGWTLGLSALGEGSSKDTRSGFTPH